MLISKCLCLISFSVDRLIRLIIYLDVGENGRGFDVNMWYNRQTLNCFTYRSKAIIIDFNKTVHLHGPAQNSDLYKIDGTPCKLFSYMQKSRPLVINFGSCS